MYATHRLPSDDETLFFCLQMEDYPTPRALGKEEIPGIIADFRWVHAHCIGIFCGCVLWLPLWL